MGNGERHSAENGSAVDRPTAALPFLFPVPSYLLPMRQHNVRSEFGAKGSLRARYRPSRYFAGTPDMFCRVCIAHARYRRSAKTRRSREVTLVRYRTLRSTSTERALKSNVGQTIAGAAIYTLGFQGAIIVMGWQELRRCGSGAAGMSERNATTKVVREAGRGTSRERSEKTEPRFGGCAARHGARRGGCIQPTKYCAA